MTIETTLAEMHEDYDWQEVFNYAGGVTQQGQSDPPEPVPGSKASNALFRLNDVLEIYGSSNGQHDADDWVAYGRLKDGRFFAIHAGCDYTGWD